jgi:hypothetical protein
MEEKIKNITKIIDQFGQEEMGNRLSQFAWLSFKNIILGELNKEITNASILSEHTDKG